MKKHSRLWRYLSSFFIFFLINCFAVTCSFILFLQSLNYSSDQLRQAAPVTAGNVIFISLIFAGVYHVINYFTVDKPVRKIRKGLERVTKGDFSQRLDENGVSRDFLPIVESINTMTEELSSVETLKTDFISNVSHEIKTPLAVMQNYSQLLQSENITDEERIEYAASITSASERLSSLITNILRLNRLENQQLKPKAEEFDLGAQLGEAVLGFEQVWTDKEIELSIDIPDEVAVSSDKELLSLVWNNLLSNAFKFTESGGTVGVQLEADEEYAIVKIRDTGCGISADTGRHIFDKFYQGDTSRASQGNGLGLALVKRVIDIIGSEISVSSTLGEGSTFTVKLRRSGDE